MRVPRPVTVLLLTFSFPILLTTAFSIGLATLGEVFIGSQVSLLSFMIQKYFWSEAEFHQVKQFFMFRKS